MIRSFRDRTTERLWAGSKNKRCASSICCTPPAISKTSDLQDLGAAPGNRLEALAGHRKGQHSIRINGQWRICFSWTKEGPTDVEIVDYH